MEPISKYRYLGNRVDVYEDRLEYTPPGGVFARKDTILFRDIASIESQPLSHSLEVKTKDGKSHRVSVSPGDVANLKDQIETLR